MLDHLEEDRFHLSENSEEGVVLECSDVELADEFDDYISIDRYVLYNLKLDDKTTFFYFGQASCIEKVKTILQDFLRRN